MDIAISQSTVAKRNRRRSMLGLTIVEMMITMGIFGFAMTAFIYAYIFGLKQDQLVQSKCGASDESRRSFEKVARDIRSANSLAVGNYIGGTFTACLNGSTNFYGNALQIFLASAPNTNCIIYYYNTNNPNLGTWTLNRIHSGDATTTVIASNLQNSATFSAENFQGVVQSAMLDKYVIHFTLDFVEFQYPLTMVGTNHLYDRYVVDFRATPHVPGGK